MVSASIEGASCAFASCKGAYHFRFVHNTSSFLSSHALDRVVSHKIMRQYLGQKACCVGKTSRFEESILGTAVFQQICINLISAATDSYWLVEAFCSERNLNSAKCNEFHHQECFVTRHGFRLQRLFSA
jgi:hypothetical protein